MFVIAQTLVDVSFEKQSETARSRSHHFFSLSVSVSFEKQSETARSHSHSV
jgi:hypothetical protein